MRTFLRWTASVVLAVLLGLGSAIWAIQAGTAARAVRNGAWQTSRATGSADASMYVRAQVAVAGLLALTQSEAMYYRAAVDDAGQPLDGSCDYLRRRLRAGGRALRSRRAAGPAGGGEPRALRRCRRAAPGRRLRAVGRLSRRRVFLEPPRLS